MNQKSRTFTKNGFLLHWTRWTIILWTGLKAAFPFHFKKTDYCFSPTYQTLNAHVIVLGVSPVVSVVTQLWLAWAGLVGRRSWAGSGQPEPDIGIQLRQMSQDSDPCFQGNCFLESAWMQLSTGLHHLTASHSAEQLGKRWGRHGGRACCFCSHIHTLSSHMVIMMVDK